MRAGRARTECTDRRCIRGCARRGIEQLNGEALTTGPPIAEPSLVSVVVPNYNGAAFLAECLDSVRLQRYEPIEAIVVDDGSTDGSAEIVATRYPELRLIRHERNRGFA